MPFELHPVEIPRASLIVALWLFRHQALQSPAVRLIKEQGQFVGIPQCVARIQHKGVVNWAYCLLEDLQTRCTSGVSSREWG
jgi:hypothetical protein